MRSKPCCRRTCGTLRACWSGPEERWNGVCTGMARIPPRNEWLAFRFLCWVCVLACLCRVLCSVFCFFRRIQEDSQEEEKVEKNAENAEKRTEGVRAPLTGTRPPVHRSTAITLTHGELLQRAGEQPARERKLKLLNAARPQANAGMHIRALRSEVHKW